jgi:hypothetical protein
MTFSVLVNFQTPNVKCQTLHQSYSADTNGMRDRAGLIIEDPRRSASLQLSPRSTVPLFACGRDIYRDTYSGVTVWLRYRWALSAEEGAWHRKSVSRSPLV